CPDVATCQDCLAELFDPANRRYRYPFTHCTTCGPRFSIVQQMPYDRVRTTMARFAMCAECQAEYQDPASRRFHAQTNCCARCGPRLTLLDATGVPQDSTDPIAQFASRIERGGIGALKGVGGFHLVCDARREESVRELRRRKQREARPLAVLFRQIRDVEAWCVLDDAERQLLNSPARPIVLLRRREDSPVVGAPAGGVTCGVPWLGAMLAYTPLHHLVLESLGDIPLVATSGNRSDEPIVHDDEEAVARLGGVADLFLTHDRPIHVRCDDSVCRVTAGETLPLRRSRGYVPRRIPLPGQHAATWLAVGGQMKNVFALGHEGAAILSQHIGDLDDFRTYQAFERDIRELEQICQVQPLAIAHDLHPDYGSTRYALDRAAREGLATHGVQHHHAHLASCMAEHGLAERVIGVTFDGSGWGPDKAVWGGEFLVGDYEGFWRAAHLRYVAMPGGEQAIREPWRMAAAHLLDAGLEPRACLSDVDRPWKTLMRMIERHVNSPWTSSAGRWFDAVAALVGVGQVVSYEGQAAMLLEGLASSSPDDGSHYPFDFEPLAEPVQFAGVLGTASGAASVTGRTRAEVIDTRPTMHAMADDLARGTEAAVIARRFHSTLAALVAATCHRIRERTGLDSVVLSGGVFQNGLLLADACLRLAALGFRVFRHRRVPPNDGGLSLGQLAIAAHCPVAAASAAGTPAT
ncbi:MAG: carbamoyltransferase HypF, partial [Pirellulaceae bacterium]